MAIRKKVTNAVASVLSAPAVAYHKARGMVADHKRGMALWNQGYGKYYESSLKIARKGKKFGREH